MRVLTEIKRSLTKNSTAYYAMRCCWWTTDARDLGSRNGLPCCPYCGSMLMEAPAQSFIAIAEENPAHYGSLGIDGFAQAHHGSGFHGTIWGELKYGVPQLFASAPPATIPDRRCVVCRSEFAPSEVTGPGCPRCHRPGVPMAIADDLTVSVNWHELRILCIWAEQWAAAIAKQDEGSAEAPEVVAAIVRELEKQYPEKAPLSLMAELKQVQEVYPDAEVTDSEGNVVLPKKTVN